MFEKIYYTIFNSLNNLFLHKTNILVAVSGGVDSMVLLNYLIKKKIVFHVAHANFKLRYQYSNNDESFVKTLCLNNNITIHIKILDPINYAKKNSCSIQMAARSLRSYWLESIINKIPCNSIAIGHQLDDVIETFFLNLIRGTGMKGLLSIPTTYGKLIRPLLPFSREEILQDAKFKKIIWREDLSNKENKYIRNTIRNKIIPLLRNKDFKNIYKKFSKTISYLHDDYVLIQKDLKRTLSKITIERNHNPFLWKIDLYKIIELLPLKSYLFKIFYTYGFYNTTNLEQIFFYKSGKQLFSKNYRILKYRNCFLLTFKKKMENNISIIDQINFITKPILLSFVINCLKKNRSFSYEFIDLDQVTLPFYIRNWLKGDYFYPLGMKNKKKISKFLKDKKLPLLEKEKLWLLLNSNGRIIWIIKFGLDNRFKITYHTKNILTIIYNN